jgi:hypothetical protein
VKQRGFRHNLHHYGTEEPGAQRIRELIFWVHPNQRASDGNADALNQIT